MSTYGSCVRGVARPIVLAFVSTLVALAATPPPKPGCEYKVIDATKWGNKELKNPPAISSANGTLRTNLRVTYTETTIGGCGVKLRSYVASGAEAGGSTALVGPTLRIKPGDALEPDLINELPKESAKEIQAQFEQENNAAYITTRPHSFNTTNLHTHGLHVSPNGNSDNVLLAILPGTHQQYNIKLPPNHPRGTFWYHAHSHGSTAIQVGSGMAGALIVEDDETRIPAALRAANQHEKIMVLQSILYDTQGQIEQIAALFPDPNNPDPNNPNGRVPKQACAAEPPPQTTWFCSKRRITINGQIVPIIRMRPGEVQRWRMIDTSFRESISLTLNNAVPSLPGLDLNEIALDGIYLGRVDIWPAGGTPIDLEPGYRSDILVKASATPGKYNLIDNAVPQGKGLLGGAEPENVLAQVIVEGEPMDMRLPTNEEMLPLAPFPGVNLNVTAVGVQEVLFKLGTGLENPNRNYFQVNYHSFNPDNVRILKLGATEAWHVTTIGDPPGVPNAIPPAPHVFHIHINPFQTLRSGPNGQPEMVWKDTLLIPPAADVMLYTRYLDFTGTFVMHCHILDHEDLGMMELDEVTDTGLVDMNMNHAH
ncbi:MAG: multicopper oxidase domain-containing protein [Acidobacteriia bacterium]|nr:multicopper oxidase domain-containing protein [Terriglobia bacterium]